MNPVARSDGLDFVDLLRSNETSSLGKRLEASLKGKRHPFEQASVNYIGKGMPVKNAAKIRRKL